MLGFGMRAFQERPTTYALSIHMTVKKTAYLEQWGGHLSFIVYISFNR